MKLQRMYQASALLVSKKKYSIEQVADIVNSEGLGYAIQHYMSGDNIEDPELAKQWEKAKATLNIIEMILKDHLDQVPERSWRSLQNC